MGSLGLAAGGGGGGEQGADEPCTTSSQDADDGAGEEALESDEDGEFEDEEGMLRDEDDQEYQRLRRMEVSWKFQKLKKHGGMSGLVEAENEFAALEEEGIAVDARLATDLISAYMRFGRTDRGLEMFEKYFGKGDLQVDDILVAVLLRGLGAATPPDWTSISSLLGRVEKEFNLKFSVVMYNELLAICSKSGAVGKGLQVIDEMAENGVEADWGTLAAVKQKKSLRSHFRRKKLV